MKQTQDEDLTEEDDVAPVTGKVLAELTDEEAATFIRLADEEKCCKRAFETAAQTFRKALFDILGETRRTWEALSAKHGFDIKERLFVDTQKKVIMRVPEGDVLCDGD